MDETLVVYKLVALARLDEAIDQQRAPKRLQVDLQTAVGELLHC